MIVWMSGNRVTRGLTGWRENALSFTFGRGVTQRNLKGVCRKGMLLQEVSVQQQQLPDESASNSHPPVYVPSAETEGETQSPTLTPDSSSY